MSAAELAAAAVVAAAAGFGCIIGVHVAVDLILRRAEAAAAVTADGLRAAAAEARRARPGTLAGLVPGVVDPGPGAPPATDPRCAAPGDPDLDLDLYNLVLDDVVHTGNDFMLAGTATDGAFVPVDAAGSDMEPVSKVEMAVTFGIPTAPDDQVRLYAAHLDAWVADRTPLRLVSAPGKVSLLWDPAPGGFVMPLPRT